MPFKIIISGGGTGGHIYPAIAIANELRELSTDCEILFVGAENRMEMQKVPASGYSIVGLDITGIQRSLSPENLKFPFKVLKSLKKAKKVLKTFRPNVCVGVGGYASGPTLFAASLMKIPTLIQEQNSYAGITNKLLAKRAKKICVAYPGMERFFAREKIIFTGNPVRKDILEVSEKRFQAIKHFGLDEKKKTLLVIGGSLGARTINQSIEKWLHRLVENDVQMIWQTGKTYFQQAQKAVSALQNPHIKVLEFINQMDLAYATADVVISRAGALSISELCLVAKPTIFVPSPNVSEDHQTKNAQVLVQSEAALMVSDVHAPDFLVGDALNLLRDFEMQKKLSQNIKSFARPKASYDIARQILELCM